MAAKSAMTNEVISPSACIERELLNFLQKMEHMDNESTPILVFPATLGPILTKNLYYLAAMHDLSVVYIDDNDLTLLAVCQRQHIREFTGFNYKEEDIEPARKRYMNMKSKTHVTVNGEKLLKNGSDQMYSPVKLNTKLDSTSNMALSLINKPLQQTNYESNTQEDLDQVPAEDIIDTSKYNTKAINKPVLTLYTPLQTPVTVSLVTTDINSCLTVQYDGAYGNVVIQKLFDKAMPDNFLSSVLNVTNFSNGSSRNTQNRAISYLPNSVKNTEVFVNGIIPLHPGSQTAPFLKKYKSNSKQDTDQEHVKHYYTKYTQTKKDLTGFGKPSTSTVTNQNPTAEMLDYIIELYEFPSTYTTNSFLNIYKAEPRYVKWYDGKHVLLVTGSPDQAKRALRIRHKYVKSRPITESSSATVKMARKFLPAGKINTMVWTKKGIAFPSSE